MKKKVNDIEGFINIIEEISWILDGKSVNLKDVVKQLRQVSSADAPLKNSSSRSWRSSNNLLSRFQLPLIHYDMWIQGTDGHCVTTSRQIDG